MSSDVQSPRLLDGKATAREIRGEVAKRAAAWTERHGSSPGLTVLLVGEDPASQIYVRNKERAARRAGLRSTVVRLPDSTSESEIVEQVERHNADPDCHGILVQLPLPRGVQERRVLETIDPDKDVDGFHPTNAGRLSLGLPGFEPCTPAGIVELLQRNEIPLEGRNAVVIGRSNIVGKPMALLLLRENCTVTVCHSRTRDLPEVCSRADLLIAAVGRRGMVTDEFIRPDAVVVDVGIHRVETEEDCRELYGDDTDRLTAVRERGSTLVGDVHPLAARRRAGWFTPVPGGVGPLTIARLLHNTMTAAERLR